MKYSARIIETITQPGSGWGLRVGVFRGEGPGEEQIGEYHRNYQALFHTFCAFQSGGKDYALFSPQYSVTRVMELPSCVDIGGEQPRSEGFCPTDYYVPSYIEAERSSSFASDPVRCRINEPPAELLQGRAVTKTWPGNSEQESRAPVSRPTESWSRTQPLSPLVYYPFGFVAGCVWGDDATWKIQYLDLSAVQNGIVKRDDRFGYIELPEGMRLRDAVDMEDYLYDGEFSHIRIAVMKTFDLRTGKDCSPTDPNR